MQEKQEKHLHPGRETNLRLGSTQATHITHYTNSERQVNSGNNSDGVGSTATLKRGCR